MMSFAFKIQRDPSPPAVFFILTQINPVRKGVLCFHRSRYHTRTDSRRVARGCARGRVKRRRVDAVLFQPGRSKTRVERGVRLAKGPRKTRPGFAIAVLSTTTSIRRLHCPAVTCSDRALTLPPLAGHQAIPLRCLY